MELESSLVTLNLRAEATPGWVALWLDSLQIL